MAQKWVPSRYRPLMVPVIAAFFVGAGMWLEAHRVVPAATHLPPLLDPGAAALAAYLAAYVTGGYESAVRGLTSLRRRRIDIDFLMVAAATGAALIGQARDGAILIFIFALSNALESYALGRTRKAVEALVRLRPTRARRVTGVDDTGSEPAVVDVEALLPGDVVKVLPGEQIPADGVVIRGRSSVDASAITGESVPQERGAGTEVFAGSVSQDGVIWVEVRRAARDSTLARIIHLVEEAQEGKAPTQLFIERFEQVYAAAVVGLTLLFIALPPVLLGWDFKTTLYRAMTVMVVASPCAVVLSTMPAMLSAMAKGARNGVLFKGALYLEQLARIRVVAFDKTGTLTLGRPELAQIVPAPGFTEDDILKMAASAELASEHPVARAIAREARRRGIDVPVPEESRSRAGRGVEAVVHGDRVMAGSPAWFEEIGRPLGPELAAALARLEEAGQTAMVVSVNGSGPVGVIGVADRVRPHAAATVSALRRIGVRRVVMLTGDNARVAGAIGAQVGVDEVHAALLPEAKMHLLRELEARFGPVAMVGDGVNDAPALASAAVGIAMGEAGTDVALQTADIILMSDDLTRLEGAIAIGRRAERVVRQNLALAFGVMAALLVAALTGRVDLTQGVVGHEGSTVLVALNGLRLLGYRWPGARKAPLRSDPLEVAAQEG